MVASGRLRPATDWLVPLHAALRFDNAGAAGHSAGHSALAATGAVLPCPHPGQPVAARGANTAPDAANATTGHRPVSQTVRIRLLRQLRRRADADVGTLGTAAAVAASRPDQSCPSAAGQSAGRVSATHRAERALWQSAKRHAAPTGHSAAFADTESCLWPLSAAGVVAAGAEDGVPSALPRVEHGGRGRPRFAAAGRSRPAALLHATPAAHPDPSASWCCRGFTCSEERTAGAGPRQLRQPLRQPSRI